MKAAHVYAERLGWAVVPLHDVTAGACSCRKPDCPSAGKHPTLKGWQDIATSDLEQIHEWQRRYPAGNIGIATGTASGFFAFDVDPDHGGSDTLAAIVAEHGPMPVTPEQITGSGGRHYLFKLPTFAVTNKATKGIGQGLDVRGNGGQIVVAPSRSFKGSYRWVKGREPWSLPLADAPDWLLERLRVSAAAFSTTSVDPTSRGFFPAANEKVLTEARAELARHGAGPERVDGEGGGMHAVQAGAILMHDYALTEEEAWPLFVEWNETRDPPFGEDELRERLRRGLKYGKAEFGKRRHMDAVEAVRKLATDWRAAGAGEEAMFAMIAEGRKFAALSGDPAKRKVIQNELEAATGLGARDLDLPKPNALTQEAKPEGAIEISPAIHEVADKAIAVIADDVFARNGVLCEVVKAERTFISDLETARIQDLMSKRAKWVRTDDNGVTEQAPPMPVAAILHARRSHPKVRVIEAVTTAPVFLPNGEILQVRGYNAAARVFLEPSVTVDVPDFPTFAEARAAANLLHDLVRDFHFRERADFTTWLAAMLTPLVKSAIGNAPAPLFCVSASSPGAGKSLLTEVISAVVTGGDAEIRPYNPRDPGEWGKRLTAFVKAASPISVFDNCNGPIGDEGLDRLITSATWSDRILGASDAPPLPNVTTWMATGNNIEPIGDTVRRSALIRIEVDVERPHERTGFKYPELKRYALEHRSELLSAALTILRAYHVAERPDQKLETWGSFTAWSDLVRGSLVWLGLPDPYITQKRAQSELNEADGDAHDFWLSVVNDSEDGFAGSIVALANKRDAGAILGIRDAVTSHSLRKFIARFVDRVRQGKRIRREREDTRNQVRYYVERV